MIPAHHRVRRTVPWEAVAGMLALASALGIGRFVYTPILPPMAAALGWSKGLAGLVASANFAGYLLGALAAASPLLPGGRRAWFAAALAIGAATTIAMAFADGAPAILALRFTGGAASAFVLVLGTAAVLDSLAASRQPGWRWVHYSGVGLGIAASAAAVALLEAGGAGWRTLWLVAGLAAAAILPVPLAILRWPPPPSSTPSSTPQSTQRQDRPGPVPGLVPLAIGHALVGFGYIVTATFLIAIIRASPAASAMEPVAWAVVGLTAIPSTFVWDAVAARLGVRPAYAIACLVLAIGVIAGGAWPSTAGVLIAAVLLGATFMGLTALGFAAARELGPAAQPRSFALLTAAFGTGQAIGPTLGGALSDATGGFAIPSAVAAAALLTAAIIVTRNRRVSSRG